MTEDVRCERLPAGAVASAGPFPEALRTGRGAAVRFLPALPRDDAAWDEVVRATRARAPSLPPGLPEALAGRQRVLGAGPGAERAARRLGEEGALAVVAGQQPGLLGGLLLAFHKAAGARNLAARLDARSETPVVPVFWLASEDHDLDEANRLLLLDRESDPRRLRLDRRADGRSLMHLPVGDDEAAALVAEAASLLPDTDRARAALACAGAAPAGADLATWCARSFAALLGDAGVVVLEPPLLLPYAGEALAGLLEEAEPIARALHGAASALREAGLRATLDVGEDYVPLFLRDEPSGPRRRVRRDAGHPGRLVVDGGGSPDLAEVAARVRARPALASGDVVGRVFVQDRLLPVLATVGGPTELAYLAQVFAAHEAVGLSRPLAVPRPEATWVDAKTARAAEAFGTTIPHLLAGALPETPPRTGPDLSAALEAWRRRLLDVPGALADAGGATGAARDRAVGRLEQAWQKAARDLEAAWARDAGVGARRWARLRSVLAPRGRPQERALSAVSLVARSGIEAFRAGLAALDPLHPGHHVLHVG